MLQEQCSVCIDGSPCPGSEHKQHLQCMLCYTLLSNEAMKPSNLWRHLKSKHKEHATKSIKKIKNKEQQLPQSRKLINKITTGSCNESAVKVLYEVSMLIAKAGKPRRIFGELLLRSWLVQWSEKKLQKFEILWHCVYFLHFPLNSDWARCLTFESPVPEAFVGFIKNPLPYLKNILGPSF